MTSRQQLPHGGQLSRMDIPEKQPEPARIHSVPTALSDEFLVRKVNVQGHDAEYGLVNEIPNVSAHCPEHSASLLIRRGITRSIAVRLEIAMATGPQITVTLA